MSDIQIVKINASWIEVHSEDEGVRETIYQYFRYEEPTFKPNRFSKWDGVVRLYDKRTGRLPYGLIQTVLSYAKEMSWTVEIDPWFKDDINPLPETLVDTWIEGLNLCSVIEGQVTQISPYDYQRTALKLAIKYNRFVALAATSAGKSLIAYMLTRWYQEINPDGAKTLLVVPSINLVSQMSGDFADYSRLNGWDAARNIHTISEGAVRYSNKPIFISTWQSLQDMPDEYFHQFANIIVDEVHGAQGKKLQKILNAAINAHQRVGMTGTLKKDKISPTMIQGCFGPIKRIVKTKQLQEAGQAAQTQVTLMQLNYDSKDRKELYDLDYAGEIDWLIAHPFRNQVIKSLARSLKGNSLVLFDRVDKHLELIYQQLVIEDPSRKYYMISGKVDGDQREEIKKLTESGEDVVILASFGTMSTGVSIRKLHNLIIAHPTKSIIRILQSLGRTIRLHSTKIIANIYHLVDEGMYSGRQNYSLKHGLEAYTIYQEEEHAIKVRKVQMRTRNYADTTDLTKL